MNFEMIERERKKQKLSVALLCRSAGVSARCYERIRAGNREARGDTLAKLTAGLRIAGRGDRAGLASRTLFRLVLAQLADRAGLDPVMVLAHNPQLKATASPEWMAITQLRETACYMLNTVLGLPNAEVAMAAGVTPPAITQALRKMEDKREAHPELEKVFAMLEAAVQT